MDTGARPTPLTSEMIDDCPAVDIHVHAPGMITPQIAWELGIRNGYIEVYKNEASGEWRWREGKEKISPKDPVGRYCALFQSRGHDKVLLGPNGKPVGLEFNYHCLPDKDDMFGGFDAIMGTVQGHRNPPGGIRTEDDYRFVMRKYLESCKAQNIRYTEMLQNICIAEVLYPGISSHEARSRFFLLCKSLVGEFAAQNVYLRFHHCANKTKKSGLPGTLEERSLEWANWLKEAQEQTPGVFVALNSAGHEEQEKHDGGPAAMSRAYRLARAAGLGTEAHAGEGIGVEHMQDTIRMLPVTRIAHGVQVIESKQAIEEVRRRGITLVMMPSINVALGSPIHVLETPQGDIPHSKYIDGRRDARVKTKHITTLAGHPFFPLLREHGLKIALATDNPGMGGRPYKEQIKLLAGIGYEFPRGFTPLTAEELALCNLNAIDAAFCAPEVKRDLIDQWQSWMQRYGIEVAHPLLAPQQRTYSTRP